jgi:hypothetical protein
MSKNKSGTPQNNGGSSGNKAEHFRRGGYQPTNEGYTPDSSKGYSATNSQTPQKLPKAPQGGTGVTPPATSQTNADSKS